MGKSACEFFDIKCVTGVLLPLKVLGVCVWDILLHIELFKDFFWLFPFFMWLTSDFFPRGEKIDRKFTMAYEYGCKMSLRDRYFRVPTESIADECKRNTLI